MVGVLWFRHYSDEIESIENEKAAVAALIRGGFDLIILDVRIPNMHGLKATRKIRIWERDTGLIVELEREFGRVTEDSGVRPV